MWWKQRHWACVNRILSLAFRINIWDQTWSLHRAWVTKHFIFTCHTHLFMVGLVGSLSEPSRNSQCLFSVCTAVSPKWSSVRWILRWEMSLLSYLVAKQHLTNAMSFTSCCVYSEQKLLKITAMNVISKPYKYKTGGCSAQSRSKWDLGIKSFSNL